MFVHRNLVRFTLLCFFTFTLIFNARGQDPVPEKPAVPEVGRVFPFSESRDDLQIASLSENTFLLANKTNDGRGDYKVGFRVGRVEKDASAEKIEYGDEVSFNLPQHERNFSFFKLIALNDSEAVLVYKPEGSSENIRLRHIKVDAQSKTVLSPMVPTYEVPSLSVQRVIFISAAKLSGNSIALSVTTQPTIGQNNEGLAYVVSFNSDGGNQVIGPERFAQDVKQLALTTIVPLSATEMVIAWRFEYDSTSEGIPPGQKLNVVYAHLDFGRLNFARPKLLSNDYMRRIERLQGVALSSKDFLLSYKNHDRSVGDQEIFVTGSVFKGSDNSDQMTFRDHKAFSISPNSYLNLTVISRNFLTANYSKDGVKSETFLRVLHLVGDEILISDELEMNSAQNPNVRHDIQYSFARLAYNKFLIGYFRAESGIRIGKLVNTLPEAKDSSPSLLKTVALDDRTFVNINADKGKFNSGYAEVKVITADGGGLKTASDAFSPERTLALTGAALDSSRVLVMYRSAGKTQAVVGTVGRDPVISFGRPTEFEDNELLRDLSVVPLSNGKVVFAYRTENNYSVVRLASIQGNEIKLSGGRQYLVDDRDLQNISFDDLAVAGAGDNLVIVYNYTKLGDKADRIPKSAIRRAWIAGDKIEFDSQPINIGYLKNPSIEFLSNNKFALAYRASNEKNVGRLLVGEIAGDGRLNLAAPVTFSSEKTFPVALAKGDENSLVVTYGNYDITYTKPVDKVFARFVSLDGINAALGNPLQLSDQKTSLISVGRLTPNEFVFALTHENMPEAEVKFAAANKDDSSLTLHLR